MSPPFAFSGGLRFQPGVWWAGEDLNRPTSRLSSVCSGAELPAHPGETLSADHRCLERDRITPRRGSRLGQSIPARIRHSASVTVVTPSSAARRLGFRAGHGLQRGAAATRRAPPPPAVETAGPDWQEPAVCGGWLANRHYTLARHDASPAGMETCRHARTRNDPNNLRSTDCPPPCHRPYLMRHRGRLSRRR